MSQAENEALVRRFLELLSRGPVEQLGTVVAKDVSGYDGNVFAEGLNALEAFAATYQSAVPDWTFEIEKMLADGDWVAFCGKSKGTVHAAGDTASLLRQLAAGEGPAA